MVPCALGLAPEPVLPRFPWELSSTASGCKRPSVFPPSSTSTRVQGWSAFTWSHLQYLCLPVLSEVERMDRSIGQKRGGAGPYLHLRLSIGRWGRAPKRSVVLSVRRWATLLTSLCQGVDAASPTAPVPMARARCQTGGQLGPPCSQLLAHCTSHFICRNTDLKLSSVAWTNEALGAALARLHGSTVAPHLCPRRMWAASWLCLEKTLTTPLYYWEEIYWRHPSLSPASPLPSRKSKHLIFFVVNRFNVHLSVA